MVEQIFITALVVWGVHAVFLPGMIFGRVSHWMGRHFPQPLQKIIYGCSVCMSPYYGSILYLLQGGSNLLELIIILAASMGLNQIIVSLLPEE